MHRHVSQRGFSLIEILFVLLIVSLLATIAVPSLSGARASAQRSAAIATLRTMSNLQQSYHLQNGRYARLCPELSSFNTALGQCSGSLLPRQSYVFYMNPLAPSDAQLTDQFRILARGYAADGSQVIFLTDESGAISQVFP
jgi:prepilin-type N-terminal cleavage/methylation domain-containing protein